MITIVVIINYNIIVIMISYNNSYNNNYCYNIIPCVMVQNNYQWKEEEEGNDKNMNLY